LQLRSSTRAASSSSTSAAPSSPTWLAVASCPFGRDRHIEEELLYPLQGEKGLQRAAVVRSNKLSIFHQIGHSISSAGLFTSTQRRHITPDSICPQSDLVKRACVHVGVRINTRLCTQAQTRANQHDGLHIYTALCK